MSGFGGTQAGGMCDGSVNVDGKPGGPPPNTRAARDAVYCAVKVSYNSPMGMELKYNPAEKSVQVKQDNDSNLHFKANPGSATANRDGVTRKNSCMAQLLNADMTPCITNNPDYVQVANADGSAQVLSVATGEVVSMVTKTGAVVPKAFYDNQVSVSKDSLGQITSIWSARDGLMEFSRTSTLLTMSRYAPTQVTRNSRGVVRATGTPIKVDSFKWISPDTMVIINQEAGKEAIVRERIVEGNRVIIATGKDNERVVTSYERNELPGGKWEEIKTVYDTNGSGNTLCERTVKKFTDGGWLVLSRTEGYGTALAETTSYAYNDQYRVTVKSRTDGFYTRYEYDSEGRVTLEAGPWADGDYEKVIRTTYADLRFNDNRPAVITESLMDMSGMETDTRVTAFAYEDSGQVNRTTVSTLAAGETQPLVTVEEINGEAPEGNCVYAAGRLRMSQRADGVQKWVAYENISQYGALYKVTVETRVAGQLVPGCSERTIQYLGGDGLLLRNEKYVHTGSGWSPVSTYTYEYDGEKRLTRTIRGNGRVSTKTWGCCGPLREVDEDGVSLDYGYSSARQLVEVIRSATATTPEIITSYTRDSSGRILQTREDIGAMHRIWSRTYDILGRKTSRTDIKGRTTAYSYQNHGLKKVTALPTGAMEILEWNVDSSLHYQAPAGARACTLNYSREENACTTTRQYTGNRIPGYEVADWHGRALRTYRASIDPSLNDQLTVERQYNAKGQLISLRERGVLTQYEYDSMGEISRMILPLAEMPTILNSRITDYAYAYEERADGVYRVVTATTYDAEGQPLVSSRAELVSALSPTLESKAVLTDIYGKVTTEWTEYDGPTRRKSYKTIPTSGITAETRLTDGFAVHEKDTAGVESTSIRAYTASGCTVTTTDGRGNTFTTRYDTADRVILVTDGAGNSTATVYDVPTSRPSVITDALGKTTCYKYDDCERISAVYGTGAQPACCEYDEGGNLCRLTTFRVPGGTISSDPTGRTDGDTTAWAYAWQEPLPLGTTYPDNTTVALGYGEMNRLATVTNGRNTTTVRSYNAATGELLSLIYGDSTPDVGYAYNHLGWITSITDGSGTRSLSYTHYGAVYREDGQAGSSLCRLQNMYDAYGRLSRYDVEAGNASLLAAVLAYRTDGRPDWTALERENTLHTFSRQYMTGSHLLSGMGLPGGMTQSYTYEEERDLVTEMKTGLGMEQQLRLACGYDTLARLTTRTREDSSGTQDDTYSYNDRSELTSASLEGMIYGYAYDNTGNRNTAAEGIIATAYQTNALDQYTQIQRAEVSFAPLYDADGNQTKVKTCTGIWTVSYDAENRPISFTSEDGTIIVECGYDADSRRYFKKVTENGTVVKHEHYLYNGYLQTAALDMLQGGAIVHALLWDPAQPQATRPLALLKNGTVYSCVHDQNKNVVALFTESGQCAARYSYTPFGAVTAEGTVSCPVQWSSEMYDEESGLTYYNYRYYNPQDGRWLSRDPLGAQSGLNPYAHAGNRMIPDYLGLDTPGTPPAAPAAPATPDTPTGESCPATQPVPENPAPETPEEKAEREKKEKEEAAKKAAEEQKKKDEEANKVAEEQRKKLEEAQKEWNRRRRLLIDATSGNGITNVIAGYQQQLGNNYGILVGGAATFNQGNVQGGAIYIGVTYQFSIF